MLQLFLVRKNMKERKKLKLRYMREIQVIIGWILLQMLLDHYIN